MKKKTIRTGIVGSGFSATFHFEALSKVYGTNVEVVGVHSRSTKQGGKAYAEKRGIRFFDEPRRPARRGRRDPRLRAADGPRAGLHRRAGTRQVRHLREAADRLFRRRLARFPLGPGRQAGRPGRGAGQRRPDAGGRAAEQGPAALRRELGLRPGGPEGTGDSGEDRRPDPLDSRRGGPQRLALGRLRLRGPLRRRRADRQGLPSADAPRCI